MLTSLLVWVVVLVSMGLYLAAFFLPEIHRKQDLIWSGIGLFYGLVLGIYAEQIKGGLLLGQTAGVALVVWLGWQTFQLRRELVPPEQRTPLPAVDGLQAKLTEFGSGVATKINLPQLKTQAQELFTKLKTQIPGKSGAAKSAKSDVTRAEATVTVAAPIPPQPPSPELVAEAQVISPPPLADIEQVVPEAELAPPADSRPVEEVAPDVSHPTDVDIPPLEDVDPHKIAHELMQENPEQQDWPPPGTGL